MYYKGQYKKDHIQTEKLEYNNEDDKLLMGGSEPKFPELCPDCHGSGSLADNTCSSCNGKGLI